MQNNQGDPTLASVRTKQTMRFYHANNGLMRAIKFSKQGGVVLCNKCNAEITFIFAPNGDISLVRCPNDINHVYAIFSYRYPNDPILQKGIEYSEKVATSDETS